MSTSQPSQAAASDGAEQTDVVEQPAAPENFEQPESESEATALLRSDWKFAAIVQFCRIFAIPLRLKSFAADTLESALLSPDNHRMFLSELLFKLLRADALQPYSEKDSEGWESLLYRKVSAKWPDQFDSHPLAGTSFFEITSAKRISLLFALCDWRVQDCAAVKDVIKQLAESADSSTDLLRHEPIGEDSKGNLYYYFSFNNEDCRLYKQEPPYKKTHKRRRSSGDEDIWETITTSVEEISDFLETLSASRNGKDRLLHDLVASDILPKLVESAAVRRRAEEKQAAIEAMPKKRSSRLQELTSKKEEEDRLKAKQKADRLMRQREDERVRKEREREERLLARQREDERQAELQRRLAGVHAEGPSREERAQRRHRSSQAGSSSDSAADLHGDQIQSQYNMPSTSRLSTQHTQHESDFPAAAQSSHHHQQRHSQPQDQPGTQQASRQHPRTQHAQHEAQLAQHDTQHDQAESSLPRLRPRSSRRRTFQETFAWSPLDTPVPQRRRTDLESKPRKNMAGLLAAAKGTPHSFGRNRRGRWVMPDVPEEDIGQDVKPKSGPRPRTSKAAVASSPAAPHSPAASWESGAAQHAKARKTPGASRANFPDVPDRYSLQELQQWPASPPRAAPQPTSDPSAWPPGPHLNWQQQQQQLQQQQLRQQQLQMQQRPAPQSQFDEIYAQLTEQQRHSLSKMPHPNRMEFLANLQNQMRLSKRSQQSTPGMAWQQPSQQAKPRQMLQQQQQTQQQLSVPMSMQQGAVGRHLNQPTQQQQLQQQQYQHNLQQLTLSRLSPQQMQQLQDMPIEIRNMQFGRYMRETQLQLLQHQQMQQQQMAAQSMQVPGSMSGYTSSMSARQQQLPQQQQQLSQQQQLAQQQQLLLQQRQAHALRQQAGSGQAVVGSQTGIMQQHPYAVHPQAQMIRPNSPPGLPRVPSNTLAPHRSQVKSPGPSQTAAPNHLSSSQPAALYNPSSLAMQPGLVKQQSGEAGSGSFGTQQAMFKPSQQSMLSGNQATSNAQAMLPKQGSVAMSGSQQAQAPFRQSNMQASQQQAMLGLNPPSMLSPAQHGRPGYAQQGMAGYSPQAVASSSMASQQSMLQPSQQNMQGPDQQSMQGPDQQSVQAPHQQSMQVPSQQSMQGMTQQGMSMRSPQGIPGSNQASMLGHPSMPLLNSQNMQLMQANMPARQQSLAWQQQQQGMGLSQQGSGTHMQHVFPQGTSPRARPGSGPVASSPRAQSSSGAVSASPRAQAGSGSVPNSPMAANSPMSRSPATASGGNQPFAWQMGAAGQLPGPVARPDSGQASEPASESVQAQSLAGGSSMGQANAPTVTSTSAQQPAPGLGHLHGPAGMLTQVQQPASSPTVQHTSAGVPQGQTHGAAGGVMHMQQPGSSLPAQQAAAGTPQNQLPGFARGLRQVQQPPGPSMSAQQSAVEIPQAQSPGSVRPVEQPAAGRPQGQLSGFAGASLPGQQIGPSGQPNKQGGYWGLATQPMSDVRQQAHASNAALTTQHRPMHSLPNQHPFAGSPAMLDTQGRQRQQLSALSLSRSPVQQAEPAQTNANSSASMPPQNSLDAPSAGNGIDGAAKQAAVLQGNAGASTAVPNGMPSSQKPRSDSPVTPSHAGPVESNRLPLVSDNNSVEEVRSQGHKTPESAPPIPVDNNSVQALPQAEAIEADASAKQSDVDQQNHALHLRLHEEATQKAFSDAFLA